ncbi:SGNH/GDSL hydrolase family protein [Actinomadura yumaensis]|uniref:SGNH/GDSL hydrolase family protein n=1 Tax=Actinomadura yumaensis TaxID=111807 RepID=A0ABW2CC25_9ACTN
MTSRRARRGAAILALCLGPLTASGCTAATGRVQKAASPATKHVASAPVVMFLGDSYTVGERGALPETTYASAVARLLGWQVVVAGKAGTGFVNGGVRRSAYIQLFESQLGWRPAPDLLVVSGGHNDHRYPPDQVTGAARIVLERARQRWPRTRLALIGPIWGNETPPPSILAIRDGLRALAQEFRAPFVDPVGERWITGSRTAGTGTAARYIKRDGTHPTPEGHRYMASLLAADLRRLGLARPSRSR